MNFGKVSSLIFILFFCISSVNLLGSDEEQHVKVDNGEILQQTEIQEKVIQPKLLETVNMPVNVNFPINVNVPVTETNQNILKVGDAIKSKVSDAINQAKTITHDELSLLKKNPNHDFQEKFSISTPAHLPTCKTEVLGAFGLTMEMKQGQPAKADSQFRGYCIRDKFTCCTAKQIEGTLKDYKVGAIKVRDELASLEELLVLFRGPKLFDFMTSLEDTPACKDKVEIEGFFNGKYRVDRLDELATILTELDNYTKRQLYWIGNTYCTICNPFNHKFFSFGQENTVTGQDSTCREIMEDIDFETRVAKLFSTFIKPITDLMICFNEQEGDSEDATNLAVDPLQDEIVLQIKKEFEYCYEINDFMDPRCTKMCTRRLGEFKLPFALFKSVKQALAVVFRHFTDGDDIEEYYMDLKEKPFFTGEEDKEIKFFGKPIENGPSYESFKWQFSNTEGITIMNDHMNKKYISASVTELALLILGGLFALFI